MPQHKINIVSFMVSVIFYNQKSTYGNGQQHRRQNNNAGKAILAFDGNDPPVSFCEYFFNPLLSACFCPNMINQMNNAF